MRIRFAALLPIFGVLLTAACRDEGITRARVPKAAVKAERDRAIGEEMPLPESVGQAAPRGLAWTLPAGWKEAPGKGMRLATFTPPGGLKAEATVVALPGDSGGELDNANRWRGQIGLPPTDAAGVAASRTTISTKAGPAAVYDFTGPGEVRTRMIAVVVKTDGTTWFFKLMGDAAATESARGGFLALVKGLTPDAPK